MNILIKQWQGAGRRFSIQKSLTDLARLSELHFHEPELDLGESGSIDGIRHFEPMLRNLRKLVSYFAKERPGKIFSLAGECSGDIAAVSYLASLYPGNLAVIWIDAHGDLNTHKTTPTGNLHGMPLRLLLGEGHQQFLKEIVCHIDSRQLAFIGTRDLDPEESDYIHKNKIPIWTEIDGRTSQEINTFIKQKKVYIHFDLDVLDPSQCPYAIYKTPGGISLKQLNSILDQLSENSEVVGIGLVEYNDPESKYLNEVSTLTKKCASIVKE